jgi:hypothetical protein
MNDNFCVAAVSLCGSSQPVWQQSACVAAVCVAAVSLCGSSQPPYFKKLPRDEIAFPDFVPLVSCGFALVLVGP